MMVDVDALTRQFGPLIAQYCQMAAMLHARGRQLRPNAYNPNVFHSATSSRLPSDSLDPVDIQSPVFTSAFLTAFYGELLQHQTAPTVMVTSVFSDPVIYTNQSQLPSPISLCQDSVQQHVTAKVFNTSKITAIE